MKPTQESPATCGASSAPVCSKSESDTPRTDAAEVDQSEFADWGIGPSGFVTVEFAQILERELSIAVAALKTIAESNYSISATEPTAFANVMGAKMALHRIHTLNPGADRTRHLVPGTVEPVVGTPNQKGES